MRPNENSANASGSIKELLSKINTTRKHLPEGFKLAAGFHFDECAGHACSINPVSRYDFSCTCKKIN